MPAYWLTYKPLSASAPRGWPAEEMSDLVRQFEASPASATPLWRIASHKAQPGERVYLFKQGDGPRGIFGIGSIKESPREQLDLTDNETIPRYRARIRFNHLVDPARAFILEHPALQDVVPESLISAQASGTTVPAEVEAALEARLSSILETAAAIGADQADDPSFDPDSVSDERERTFRAIRLRRGQPAFRVALLDAYDRRCAITGCAVEHVLEAAHITPHLGPLTNHVTNGLLLRADLHTLFDCGLLAIDPSSRTVLVAETLRLSTYGKLVGKPLRAPKDVAKGPSKRNLEKRYVAFKAVRSQ